MTILATQFSLTLGAWRLRLRLDIDEPHEDDASAFDMPTEKRTPPRPALTLPSNN